MTSAEEHAAHDTAEKQVILDNIEKYGCHLALQDATDYLPGFAYSIGIYQKFGHPEFICFGLHPNVLGPVLNHACDLICLDRGSPVRVLHEAKANKISRK